MARQIEPVISIVQYDYTSSDDGLLSDLESGEGQAFVYSSSHLPGPTRVASPTTSSSSSVSDDDSAEWASDVEPASSQPLKIHPKHELLSTNSPAPKTVIPISDSSTDSDGRSDDSDSADDRAPAQPDVVGERSRPESADLELQPASPSAKRPCLEEARESLAEMAPSADHEALEQSAASPKPRRPHAYSLPVDQLPSDLRAFLADSRSFFTRPHALQRLGQCLSASTYDKAEERMLCYLGFAKKHYPGKPLAPDAFDRGSQIESYLDYLRDGRLLSPCTVSNHASALLYPLKYLHRRQAPEFASVPLIKQLRRTSTELLKVAAVSRPQTREELLALNRWLDWDEVLEALSRQRSRFEVAVTKKRRAREAADLLLLSLYCHIPPSRGLEIRTLEMLNQEEPFKAADFRTKNIVLLRRSGPVTIHIQVYKTRRFTGHEQIELESASELCQLLRRYVREFRPQLCSPEKTKGSHLFLNVHGEPFLSGSFSAHLKNLMLRLTGTAVSINGLRSSFLTWAYGRRDCTDQMKESLAVAMRHSRQQAQSTYDRRTANEKKALAVDLARSRAEGGEAGPDDDDDEQSEGQATLFSPGDFVGLVEEGSTLQQPRVLVGRVHSLLSGGRAGLLWYKALGGGIYGLELDGSRWEEPLAALSVISVKPAKGKKPNCYRLSTSLRTLHKAVHGERQN